MSDDMVTEYLKSRGSPSHVVKSGLAGLLRSWERTVDEAQSGYKCDLDDWLNDLDVRTLIHEVSQALPSEMTLGLMRRLNLADWRFEEATTPVDECVWGDENARQNRWSRDAYWWLWRTPRRPDVTDPRD